MRLKYIIGCLMVLQAMRPLLNSSVIPRRSGCEWHTNFSPLSLGRQLSAAPWASISLPERRVRKGAPLPDGDKGDGLLWLDARRSLFWHLLHQRGGQWSLEREDTRKPVLSPAFPKTAMGLGTNKDLGLSSGFAPFKLCDREQVLWSVHTCYQV